MKKNVSDKMMRSEEAENKGLPSKLVCVRECVCPGYGHFQEGEEITGPDLIRALIQSPYFKTQEDK